MPATDKESKSWVHCKRRETGGWACPKQKKGWHRELWDGSKKTKVRKGKR